MWESVIALLTQIFSFAIKVTPDDKERDATQEIHLPKLQQDVFIQIYDKQFNRLKNHTEIDIATDINYSLQNSMPENQRQELITLLQARIKEYRHKHNVIFKKWNKENP